MNGMNYRVLVASQSYHGKEPLTYSHGDDLEVGQLVSVNLRNRLATGIVHSKDSTKHSFKLSDIAAVFPYKLPEASLKLLGWLKEYYPAPLGALTELFVPNGSFKDYRPEQLDPMVHPRKLPKLRPEQKHALKVLQAHSGQSVLLHGDTGTGKTRLYLEQAGAVLLGGKSVLVLSPEIGLTELLRTAFADAFGDQNIVMLHSNLTNKTRQQAWQTIAASQHPLIIIGARSALFAPVDKLGLIIVDEAHDTAYKQEQQPYYQTSRVAAKMASLHGCQLILGSATPPVSDHFAFEQKKLPIIRLTKPAFGSQIDLDHQVIDLSDKSLFGQSRVLSTPLLSAMRAAIAKNEQILLFLNRRGSARIIRCQTCGWQASCKNCDTGVVYHADKHQLICHSCGLVQQVPVSCPDCKGSDLLYSVPGTKAIEQELLKLFPNVRVGRFDRDTVASQRLERLYKDIASGDIDILIGTQGLVKGFDLPKLSVVGVLQADSSLQIADYTASERTYQLISQVSGRLGRGHRAGKLYLQTYSPDSQLLLWAINKNYNDFYQNELEHRRAFLFPPNCYLLKISVKRASPNTAQKALNELREQISKIDGLQVLQPSPAYPEKQAGKYRWQLVVKAKNRQPLVELAKQHYNRFTCDLDPNSLL